MANDGTLGGAQAQSAATVATNQGALAGAQFGAAATDADNRGLLGSAQFGAAVTDADNRGFLGSAQFGVAATDADNRGLLGGVQTQVVLVAPLTTALRIEPTFAGDSTMTVTVIIPALAGDKAGSWQGVRLAMVKSQGRRKPQGRRLGGRFR